MRLTEERAQVVAARIAALLGSRPDLVRLGGDRARLARDLGRWIVSDLRIEDEITQEAVARVAGYSRGVPAGSTEWQILVDKHKEEIAARRGYVLG